MSARQPCAVLKATRRRRGGGGGDLLCRRRGGNRLLLRGGHHLSRARTLPLRHRGTCCHHRLRVGVSRSEDIETTTRTFSILLSLHLVLQLIKHVWTCQCSSVFVHLTLEDSHATKAEIGLMASTSAPSALHTG